MLCPNCDRILNLTGCQACGWKHGDTTNRDEMIHPRKPGADYGFARAADAPKAPVGGDERPVVVSAKFVEQLQTENDALKAEISRLLGLAQSEEEKPAPPPPPAPSLASMPTTKKVQ